jgi:hypothetical protein
MFTRYLTETTMDGIAQENGLFEVKDQNQHVNDEGVNQHVNDEGVHNLRADMAFAEQGSICRVHVQ